MHWSERIEKILSSKSSDLRELAIIAGFDPIHFYANQDLSGCDLRGQDLRGINLVGTNLENAIIDDATKIDPEFDPRLIADREIDTQVQIPATLNTMVLNYNIEKKIRRAEAGYERLLLRSLSIVHTKNYFFYSSIIDGNEHLRSIIDRKPKRSDIYISLSSQIIRSISYFFRENDFEDIDVRRMILVGLLENRIKPGSKKDYSQLSLNAFYPPRLIRVERSLNKLL
jgi:hypothetical protein